ncbi:MAG TPA: aminotransferase class I/II-fold pyridoxal phosphate-dependent enzyme [Actinomycetaceae bacterium]|nr:aminotransferase class I/II-fold pyridoxal phosphate-dependent enzyme [Actinomycetaceae bacterium]
MATGIDFAAITEERLRAVGASKWTRPGVIGAFVAEMDFGVAAPVSAALHEMVDLGRFGYPPPRMLRDMQEAYAGWSAEHYGWEVDPKWVRPMPDVLSALSFMLEHLVPARSKVILPTPAYMPFFVLPPMLGHEIVEVPMARDYDSWVFDLDALDAALSEDAGILILCNPHNPIGRVLEPGEMAPLTELAEKHGVRVFSDEIHAPLMFPGHAHVPYASTSEAAARHTVTAASASKAWNLPGLKTAQIIFSNESDAALWREVGMFIEHGASNAGLVANAAAYRHGEPWLNEVLAYLDETRTWFAAEIAERLPGSFVSVPEGTYLSLVDFRGVQGADRWGDEPARFFEDHARVKMVEGSECGVAARGWARFNLATTRPIIAEAIDRMAAAIQ